MPGGAKVPGAMASGILERDCAVPPPGIGGRREEQMSDVGTIKGILLSVVVAAETEPWEAKDFLLQQAAESLARYINFQIAEKTGTAYVIPTGVK